MNMTAFSKWLEARFLEWQSKSGERQTVGSFADYLDVSRPLVSMWMNARRTPSAENQKILARYFGNEVYDVLNVERPDPNLEKIQSLWGKLPAEAQQKIAEQAAKYVVENEKKQTGKPAPESA